ncbi:MAG: YXWGXW repeat-containing protein [Labilithrix sp.]|nr:YXWGXW repeat-containing protein [Labilithrix sp.]
MPLALVALVGTVGCGARVPLPRYAQVRADDYVPVPYPPRPPPVEIVPLRPEDAPGAVWADGGWEWSGERYEWKPGAWVVPPRGARRVRWVIVRRRDDGQLFFAPSSWRAADDAPIDAPLPLVRAEAPAR